jgi:hypothetical protein
LLALVHLQLHWRRDSNGTKGDHLYNYLNILWPLFYFEFPAFCAPLALEYAGIESRRLLLVAIGGLLVWMLPQFFRTSAADDFVSEVRVATGVDLLELHNTIGLPGRPLARVQRLVQTRIAMLPARVCERSFRLLAEATELQWTGMQVHARMVEGGGEAQKTVKTTKKTKLAVLGGDWLLAQAVVRLAEIGNQDVVQMMSDGIKAFVIADARSDHEDVILLQALKALTLLVTSS